MKYKALIFDMDGTIIDTNDIWDLATKKIFQKKGFSLTPEQEQQLLSQFTGLALHECCRIIKETVKCNDSIENIMFEKSQIANDLFKKNVRFMNGFINFHKKVIQLGLKVGLATNADDATLRITNQKLNLEKFFGQHIYNISHVNNKGKPDPALYLHTANQLNVDPQQCIAIEDSKHGIKAAVNA